MRTAGDESGDVGHVHQENRVDFACDLGEGRVVDDAGIGARAADDHPRSAGERGVPHRIVVDKRVVVAHSVRRDLEELPGEVDPRAVRQMAAVAEIHAEDAIARFQAREIGGEIGGGARVGLHVGVIGPEELAGAAPGRLLHSVHELAAAVVAPARQPFGIFVGQDRTHGLHDRAGDVILGCDELDAVGLAALFGLQRSPDLRIRVPQVRVLRREGVGGRDPRIFTIHARKVLSRCLVRRIRSSTTRLAAALGEMPSRAATSNMPSKVVRISLTLRRTWASPQCRSSP